MPPHPYPDGTLIGAISFRMPVTSSVGLFIKKSELKSVLRMWAFDSIKFDRISIASGSCGGVADLWLVCDVVMPNLAQAGCSTCR